MQEFYTQSRSGVDIRMEEILFRLGPPKYGNYGDVEYIRWCKVSSICSRMVTAAVLNP